MTAAKSKQEQKPAERSKAAGQDEQRAAAEQALEPASGGFAEQPEAAPPRTTVPRMPFVVGPNSQDACYTIQRVLGAVRPCIRDAGASAANAKTLLATIPVRNLHPSVASYKVEAIEYVGGLLKQHEESAAAGA